jgi:hypothetical protein
MTFASAAKAAEVVITDTVTAAARPVTHFFQFIIFLPE